ncbi:type II toxin-antitoxin system RelE/ParE family toxin [Methylobacterium sp. ARG-1]|uniref:type II toxin-antitoxin system RelE/ParE family toxin n=1 Tax=Methylobacterium sp. ARG-1 TaxID=1692501 RepID=UPI00329A4C50
MFRAQARADLANIFRTVFHLSQDVPTARRFTQRIKDRCDRIGDAPHAGRPRDDLSEGLRTVPFERSAVIAYRVERGSVRIRTSSTAAGISKLSTIARRRSRSQDEPPSNRRTRLPISCR